MENRIKIGILFGGPSREREISFAGGRTVYDNLDKALFEPIPIFIDSYRNFIVLDWQYLYQGSIRDFYPSTDRPGKIQPYIESLGPLSSLEQEAFIARIGKQIFPASFSNLFDLAFLSLHGPYGEDGCIQGLLEWYQVPYTGSGILGTALGIDKTIQKRWMRQLGYPLPNEIILNRTDWSAMDPAVLFEKAQARLALPLVVKSARQGSSIGVNIIRHPQLEAFKKAINSSFFIEEVTYATWQAWSNKEKELWLSQLIDLRSGIGLPITIEGQIIYQPEALWNYVNNHFENTTTPLMLENIAGEEAILLESFIVGREFSCIVLQEAEGEPVALSPTEMLKGLLDFDYRAKYLPGLIRKETPMQVPREQLAAIQAACVQLFKDLHFQTYARIDGILSTDHTIYLNDPNTTAGMNPSSFLFHQAAEIGLSPSQLLTFLIRNSLACSIHSHKAPTQASKWLKQIDSLIEERKAM